MPDFFEMIAIGTTLLVITQLAFHFFQTRMPSVEIGIYRFHLSISFMVAFLSLVLYFGMTTIPLPIAAAVLFNVSVVLFMVLSNLLIYGGAARLTAKRGEKWIKEIDYIYLLLGVIGLVGTLNRLDKIEHHVSQLDLIAPIILATAIVLRVIKTRADIGNWNRRQ